MTRRMVAAHPSLPARLSVISLAPRLSLHRPSQGDPVAFHKLEVPLVAQSSSDTCWHASSEMIWYYWQKITGRSGPMNTLRDDFAANRPINDWPTLAKTVGMKEIGADKAYTS